MEVEQLAEDRVRLTVEVPAHDVQHAVQHAADDLAQSVRSPGFRKGKVPMPLLVQRIGKERIYAEAVDSHIGGWFWNAAAKARVSPIARPEYDYDLPTDESGDWSFTATVEVQPKPKPADWTQLEVPRREAEVPTDAVQAEFEALQRSVAELAPVEGRTAGQGDVVVVDLVAADGSAQRDLVVDLGAERLVEEIENGILGLAAGESRSIAYELGDGTRRNAEITVKEIREKVLPPLDDELARIATEFDTLEDLRTEVEGRLRGQIEEELDGIFRAAAIDELVRATGFTPAGPLVEARTRELFNGLARSLQARGIDPNSYFSLTGQSPEQLEQRLRAEASQSVARELVLEAVAEQLGIVVTDDEIREELRAAGESEADIDEFIARGGADNVRDDLRLRAALDRIAAEVKPIAPELAEARDAIWTPEKEHEGTGAKLWTPGSKES